MRMKKFFCVLLVCIMAATMLAGCADQKAVQSGNDGIVSISMYM